MNFSFHIFICDIIFLYKGKRFFYCLNVCRFHFLCMYFLHIKTVHFIHLKKIVFSLYICFFFINVYDCFKSGVSCVNERYKIFRFLKAIFLCKEPSDIFLFTFNFCLPLMFTERLATSFDTRFV